MITGIIKNKIDKIWTDIWAGGITNPLTVIEQLTYLMFIRSLDEKELEQEEFDHMTGGTGQRIFPQSAEGQSMRWSRFKDRDSREIYEIISMRVFPAIKKMKYGRLPDFDEAGELVEIADEPEAFADRVVGLYNDNGRCRELCRRTQDYIKKHFSMDGAWKVIDEDFRV